MARELNVLIVEDSAEDTELILRELGRAGFEPTHRRVETAERYCASLERGTWDIVCSDYTMPHFDAMEALRLLRESGREIPFIVVTGTINEETAVDCLKRGADNYILKENLTRLGPAVEQALRVYQERRERRRLEEQLLHAQKMETVGTLAGGLAHDFNNLLMVIFAHLDMARAEAGGESSLVRHLDQLERAARHASGITSALLTFSRRAPAEKRVVALTDCCRDASRLVTRLFPADVALEWNLPRESFQIRADSTQIQQVIMNLLVNARDAVPGGGTVRVDLTACDTRTEEVAPPPHVPAGRYLRLDVADTGDGISAEVAERIFEPFFTTKRTGQGTGLGLAIVHGIVEDHGGWIAVESQPRAGTTFSVFLPRTEEGERTEEPENEAETAVPEGTGVMIVEDNDLVRAVMVSALRDAGYTLFQASDGLEALRIFASNSSSIQIVVADLELPDMRGTDCLSRIRAESPRVAGLIITGRSDAEDLLAPSGPAACPVLYKPFQMKDLRRAIGRILGERSPAQS